MKTNNPSRHEIGGGTKSRAPKQAIRREDQQTFREFVALIRAS